MLGRGQQILAVRPAAASAHGPKGPIRPHGGGTWRDLLLGRGPAARKCGIPRPGQNIGGVCRALWSCTKKTAPRSARRGAGGIPNAVCFPCQGAPALGRGGAAGGPRRGVGPGCGPQASGPPVPSRGQKCQVATGLGAVSMRGRGGPAQVVRHQAGTRARPHLGRGEGGWPPGCFTGFGGGPVTALAIHLLAGAGAGAGSPPPAGRSGSAGAGLTQGPSYDRKGGPAREAVRQGGPARWLRWGPSMRPGKKRTPAPPHGPTDNYARGVKTEQTRTGQGAPCLSEAARSFGRTIQILAEARATTRYAGPSWTYRHGEPARETPPPPGPAAAELTDGGHSGQLPPSRCSGRRPGPHRGQAGTGLDRLKPAASPQGGDTQAIIMSPGHSKPRGPR